MKPKSQKLIFFQRIRIYLYYILFIIVLTIGSQFITDKFLIQYAFFEAANFDDLLMNLLSIQVTIIILPLSIFGIFTEVANETYLGQNVASYMYDVKYEDSNKYFRFNYKEIIILCLLSCLFGYIFVAKNCLSAELVNVILSTIITISSLFSWINMRIHKEELYNQIRQHLKEQIIHSLLSQLEKDREKIIKWNNGVYNSSIGHNYFISETFTKIKSWVINGNDYELDAIRRFHDYLYTNIEAVNMILNGNTMPTKKTENYISLYYKEIDNSFDEMVALLLQKGELVRALKLSRYIIEVNTTQRKYNYYHLNNYTYEMLCKIFRNMNEIELDLLGDNWLVDYFMDILGNGNIAKMQHYYLANEVEIENVKTEIDDFCFENIVKESCSFVFNSLIAIFENDQLSIKYKENFLRSFCSRRGYYGKNSYTIDSQLYVLIMLLQTKNMLFLNIICEECFESYICIEEISHYNLDKKGNSIILCYIYYLYSSGEIGKFEIPRDKLVSFIDGKHLLTELSDIIWRYYEEINNILKNYHLLSSLYDLRSEDAALEFVLFTMLVSNPDKIFSDKNSLAAKKIIAYVPSRLFGQNSLETMWFKFKYFLELFYFYPEINEEDIWNILYDLKSKTVSYKAKKTAVDQ